MHIFGLKGKSCLVFAFALALVKKWVVGRMESGECLESVSGLVFTLQLGPVKRYSSIEVMSFLPALELFQGQV